MASAYLSRTPSSTGNRRTFTISAWVKRSKLTSQQIIFNSYGSQSNSGYFSLRFRSTDTMELTGWTTSWFETSRVFRDTSAFYHIVLAVDTTNATAGDRLRLYVNGVEETSFIAESNPSLNQDLAVNVSGNGNYVGVDYYGSFAQYFDGSMSHVHLIDGTQYSASDFGETDSTTGIWKPKTAPSVTYGTNGFFLKFENSGSMGTDSSGNANNFTVNGTMTQTIDTPSNVFATWNSLVYTDLSFGNGNTVATGSSNWGATASTLAPSKGKYYHEVKISATSDNAILGYIPYEEEMITGTPSGNGDFIGVQTNGTLYTGTGYTLSAVPTGSANDIYMFALDLSTPTTGDVYIGKNGTWFNSGNPSTGSNPLVSNYDFTSKTWSAGLWLYDLSGSANFGNGFFGTTAVSSAENPDDGIGIFEYDVPAGYRALCTKSINAEEYS